MGQVLSGKSNNAGGLLGGQGKVVSSGGLVSVSGSPDHAVGEGTEVGDGLNRLMGRAILTKTDRVVSGNPDNANAGEGSETDGSCSVGDEVEEGTTIGKDGTVGGQTVEDGAHGVLTNTISDVSAGVVTETGSRRLEVNGVLPSGQVGASQVGRATEELGNGSLDIAENNLRQLS